MSTEWESKNVIGLTIEQEYKNRHVDISMPDYISKSLERFQHPKPKKPQYALHRWTTPAYGKCIQMVP